MRLHSILLATLSESRKVEVRADADHRRCLRGALLALAIFLPAFSAASDLAPLPAHPPGVAWPTRQWPEGSLPEDLDRAQFDASVEQLFSSKGRGGFADTRALLVVQGGRVVFERYADGFGPESRFQSWSMAKSVTNALTGVLVRQGQLDVDAPAPVRSWSAPDDPRSAITLRHLLQMRSGLDNADGFGEGAHQQFGNPVQLGSVDAPPAAPGCIRYGGRYVCGLLQCFLHRDDSCIKGEQSI